MGTLEDATFHSIFVGYRMSNKTKDTMVEFKNQDWSRNLEQDNGILYHYKADPSSGVYFRTPFGKSLDGVSASLGR